MTNHNNWVTPDWPAPKNIRALTTLRTGGFSQGPYASFNLSSSGGDDPTKVAQNRQLLRETAHLPHEPLWLIQEHGIKVADLSTIDAALHIQNDIVADACFTTQPNKVCAIRTADCLPILLCDSTQNVIAAIHAGWRGLAKGIIEATVASLPSDPKNLLVWLGPAIGPNAFEVGEDVLQAFQPEDLNAFVPFGDKWKLNIYQVARLHLNRLNIKQIFGGNFCTYNEERFFSYRRSTHQSIKTGHMATLIWSLP